MYGHLNVKLMHKMLIKVICYVKVYFRIEIVERIMLI